MNIFFLIKIIQKKKKIKNFYFIAKFLKFKFFFLFFFFFFNNLFLKV
jgi:hypothetical protein